MIDKLKQIWAGYTTLSLPIKLLVGGAFSALGGAGVVGLLSEYAAYTYSLYYNVRPPLEGVPFLRVAVTTLTLLLYAGSAFAFCAIVLCARLLLWYAYRLLYIVLEFPRDSVETIKDLRTVRPLYVRIRWLRMKVRFLRPLLRSKNLTVPTPQEFVSRHIAPLKLRSILLASAILGAVAGLGFAWFSYTGNLRSSLEKGASVALLASIAVLLLWSPKLITLVASVGTLVFFALAPLSLFHAPSYAGLLRAIGYGGGLEVNVRLLSEEGELVNPQRGYMFLRTSEALLLYEPEVKNVFELPLQKVGSIEYVSSASSNESWRLPGHSNSGWMSNSERGQP